MALTDSLVSYWKMNEAANGTRLDSLGVNNLTDVSGDVGSVAGKIENTCNFTQELSAANHSLRNTAPSGLAFGAGSFTIAGWVRLNVLLSDAQEGGIASLGDGTNGEWGLTYFGTGDIIQFKVYASAGYADDSTVQSSGALSIDTWYHVLAEHDTTANFIRVAIDNGTPAETSFSGSVFNSGGDFQVGNYIFILHSNLRVDELGIWSRLLTTDEKAQLYNGGAGRSYPFGNPWSAYAQMQRARTELKRRWSRRRGLWVPEYSMRERAV